MRVDVVRVGVEAVARGAVLDRDTGAAQRRDVHLEGLPRLRRRLLAPDEVDEPVHRDDLAAVEGEHGEDPAGLGGQGRDRGSAVVVHLDRAEYPELHRAPSTGWRSTDLRRETTRGFDAVHGAGIRFVTEVTRSSQSTTQSDSHWRSTGLRVPGRLIAEVEVGANGHGACDRTGYLTGDADRAPVRACNSWTTSTNSWPHSWWAHHSALARRPRLAAVVADVARDPVQRGQRRQDHDGGVGVAQGGVESGVQARGGDRGGAALVRGAGGADGDGVGADLVEAVGRCPDAARAGPAEGAARASAGAAHGGRQGSSA